MDLVIKDKNRAYNDVVTGAYRYATIVDEVSFTTYKAQAVVSWIGSKVTDFEVSRSAMRSSRCLDCL